MKRIFRILCFSSIPCWVLLGLLLIALSGFVPQTEITAFCDACSRNT
ncbi:MAG: hypothetical protein LBE12_00560 [Planctomycetaceae bacterium]|nr:hypothetical protein [Planctomycetaceae bacterium]